MGLILMQATEYINFGPLLVVKIIYRRGRKAISSECWVCDDLWAVYCKV